MTGSFFATPAEPTTMFDWPAPTHTSPTSFYDGSFAATEATFNVDITRDFNVGLASPLTLSFGGEGRENTFAIGAGDAASTYKEGGQSYPGFQSTDAATHTRNNYAGYVDIELTPPGKPTRRIMRSFDGPGTFATDHANIGIGPDRFQGDLQTYTIHVDAAETGGVLVDVGDECNLGSAGPFQHIHL